MCLKVTKESFTFDYSYSFVLSVECYFLMAIETCKKPIMLSFRTPKGIAYPKTVNRIIYLILLISIE